MREWANGDGAHKKLRSKGGRFRRLTQRAAGMDTASGDFRPRSLACSALRALPAHDVSHAGLYLRIQS
jgi:hypothetical protein